MPDFSDPEEDPRSSGRGRKKKRSALEVPNDPLRALPADLGAERAALSAMLLDPDNCLGEVVGRVPPEAFSSPAHRIIYRALTALRDERRHLDLVTLTSVLNDGGHLEEIGGPAYLAELAAYEPTTAVFERYIEILESKRVLRAVITTCTKSITRAYEDPGDVRGLLDETEKQILDIRQSEGKSDVVHVRQVGRAAVQQIIDLFDKRQDRVSGLPYGFKDLDGMTDGMHPGEMIVLAARPSMGKTSFAMNIVENVVLDQKKTALFFSLEMSVSQLLERLICTRSGVPLKRIRDGFAHKNDLGRVVSAGKEVSECNLFLDETPSLSVLEMRAKARRVHNQTPLSLIAVDYLQLMRSTSRRAQDNRQQEIAEISSGIKALAKELRLPIVVLAQLNRKPEDRGGKPRLSDLRESGSIEQDADLVGLLVREKYYAKDDDERTEASNKAELIIAKQRNGPVGEVPLVFDDELMRFRDRARSSDEPR